MHKTVQKVKIVGKTLNFRKNVQFVCDFQVQNACFQKYMFLFKNDGDPKQGFDDPMQGFFKHI